MDSARNPVSPQFPGACGVRKSSSAPYKNGPPSLLLLSSPHGEASRCNAVLLLESRGTASHVGPVVSNPNHKQHTQEFVLIGGLLSRGSFPASADDDHGTCEFQDGLKFIVQSTWFLSTNVSAMQAAGEVLGVGWKSFIVSAGWLESQPRRTQCSRVDFGVILDAAAPKQTPVLAGHAGRCVGCCPPWCVERAQMPGEEVDAQAPPGRRRGEGTPKLPEAKGLNRCLFQDLDERKLRL